MALSVKPEPRTERPSGARRAAGRSLERTLTVAVLLVGTGTAFLVGRDGSPPWQIVRVMVVVLVTVGLYLVIDRGGRRLRAGAAFAAGCVSVAIGVGIALPHTAKTGLRPTAVAGLVVLVGGAVLLTSGGVVLVRATRRWWRAPVLLGLVATVGVVVFTLGQAVAATNVPPTTVGATTPGDRGLAYRDVEFDTVDGVTLSGWYIPSESGAAVVLMHGAGSTRSAVLDHAEVLADHGLGVVLFDARGHGGSDGRAMDFGWYGDEDTSAAVTFLQAQAEVDDERIAAVGLSMGGEQALGAIAADPRIRAAVAEGATNRTAADKAWLSDEFGWRGAVQQRIEWLTSLMVDAFTAADRPTPLRDAVVVAAPRPVLLIAGGAVEAEPLSGRHIQSASPDTVELWVVPDAGHTAALDTHPAEWEQRVADFLADALTDESAASP